MDGLNLSGFLFGNIDEEGKLENDFLDEELRVALTKKEVSAQIGIQVDLGIEREDLEVSKFERSYSSRATQVQSKSSIDYSNIEEAVPDTSVPSGTIIAEEVNLFEDGRKAESMATKVMQGEAPGEPAALTFRNLCLTRDGRILRFSNFFSTEAAHNEGKYRSRRLRLRRKKSLNKPIIYFEDQVDIFRRPTTRPKGALNAKPSLLQQILSSATTMPMGEERRRISPRQQQVEEAFINRAPVADHYVPHPEALQQVPESLLDSRRFHPVQLTAWEDSICYDAVKPSGGSSRSQFLYAGVPPAAPPSGAPSRTGSASGPSSRPNTPMSYSFNAVSQFQSRLPPSHPHAHFQQQRSAFQPPQQLAASSATAPPAPHRSLSHSSSNSRAGTPLLHMIAPRSMAGRVLNTEFAAGDWDECIVWDDDQVAKCLPSTHLQLPLNDPNLILESVDMGNLTEKILKTEKLIHKRLKKLRHGATSDGKALVLLKYDKPVNDRFNLSNDKHYEAAPSSKDGANGAVGTRASGSAPRAIMSSSRIGVQHSVPALKLSLPFYKTFWTKAELRAWHRPKLVLDDLVNRQIAFEKLVKSKDSITRKTSAGILSAAKNISLRDRSSEFVVLEYSEEFPLLMMNVGMATFIFNFYRKQQAKDVPILPDFPFGTTKVLEPNEASPFWFFGDVRPGQTLTAIQNNLFRAPLFEHQPASTDFLMLKFNMKGKTSSKWLLKEMPARISAVGQVFPTAEVFGPHSRRHNLFCRARIQSFAYRLFRKDSKGHVGEEAPEFLPRLKISRIMAAFPQFSEGSLRKWLKEYADSVRTGHDSGTWRIRRDAPILTEEDIRSLITPEMICQYESMLAGQQRLNDAGFMDAPEVEGGLDDDSAIDNESAEVRLAPWNLSVNFINATMSKCTLQLHGFGDPSGRGEAFSFVKVPLKMAVGAKLSTIPEVERRPAAPSTAATGSKVPAKVPSEQITYRQEIVKIWDAQFKALSSQAPIDEEPEGGPPADFSMFDEQMDSARNDDDLEHEESASVASKSSQSRVAGRKLVIKRIIRDPLSGEEREETETISDARLVSAYINQRRVWERKRRRREIAAAASAARAKKVRPEGASTAAKLPKTRPPSKPKKEVFVKCGTCGQVGHMRTNRICPRYAEYEASVDSEQQGKATAEPAGGSASIPLKISISKVALQNSAKLTTDMANPAAATPRSPTPAFLQYIPKPRKRKGFDSSTLDAEQLQAFGLLSECFTSVINGLFEAEGSWPFHRPVNKADYPHYYRMISKPLDLGTIRSRVKRNYYGRAQDLLGDLELIRDNCLQFNGPDHPFSLTISQLFGKAEEALSSSDVRNLETKIHGPSEYSPGDDHREEESGQPRGGNTQEEDHEEDGHLHIE